MENHDQDLLRLDKSGKYLDVSPVISLEELERVMCGRPGGEVGAAFDENGQLLFAPKVGKRGSVSFSEEEAALIDPGSIITHSHPEDFPLSEDDIYVASKMDLAEVRAVCPKKGFSMRRPKKGWPSEQKIRNAYSRAHFAADAELRLGSVHSEIRNVRAESWLQDYTKAVGLELGKIGLRLEEFDVKTKRP